MPTVATTVAVGAITATNALPVTSGYLVLVGTGLQPIPRRRAVATSPWVPGAVTVSSVQDELTYQVLIQVVGSSAADMAAKRDALVAALEAETFTLTETIGGVARSFACEAATSIDATIDPDLILNFRWNITATIPCEAA